MRFIIEADTLDEAMRAKKYMKEQYGVTVKEFYIAEDEEEN